MGSATWTSSGCSSHRLVRGGERRVGEGGEIERGERRVEEEEGGGGGEDEEDEGWL